MNQYYGNNEMEILDPGIRRSKYPYAQNPMATLQSMNYKDWVDMCTNSNPEPLFDSVRNGVIIGTAVTSFILSVSFPISAAAVGIISLLLPFMWPEAAGEPGTTQAQFTWDQLMSAVEGIVNESISDLVRSQAINTLAKLQSSINDYQQAVCNLNNASPDDPNYNKYKEIVRMEFNDAEDQAKLAIIDLKTKGYETLLLASYVQAANLHLLLLRDVVKHGENWGFSALDVQQYYSNISVGNPGMLQLLATYTEYCVKWYNSGLQQQKNTDDWNKFNDFRRNMTIMVLDLVSVWPTYNPKYYPYPTKTQLTRTLYTGLIKGKTVPTSIEDLEYYLTVPPSLFRWLRSLEFYLNRFPPNPQYLSGLQQYYQHTLSSSLYSNGLQGSSTPKKSVITVPAPENQDDIWSIIGKYHSDVATYVGGIGFQFTKSGLQYVEIAGFDSVSATTYLGFPCKASISDDCNPCDPKDSCTSANTSDPCNDASLYSHRCSHLGSYFGYYSVDSLWYGTFGWTHVSADANNLVDTEKITQIPAVKAYKLTGNAVVQSGPGSTGGDLVSLLSPDSSCNVRMAGTTHPAYQVRIRYASKSTIKEFVVARSNYSDNFTDYQSRFSVPATYSGESLTYNSFGYVTVPELLEYPYHLDWDLELYNNGTSPILIDKIELIPITVPIPEYQAKQSLENARKAVNALFTNDMKHALRLDVTDYDVDQAANKVDCMSDDLFPKEKMMLRDQVKHAKRLSQARNLLNYGDFESSDWSNENGWKVSNSVTVQANQPISRGRYLNMPGARSIEFSSTLYPTYVYQKVEESKLKPYTRYLVRGFVGNSKDLELFVTRYGKEIHNKMDIPFSPTNPYNPTASVSNSCGMEQVSTYTMSSDPCQTNTYVTNPSGIQMSSTNGLCEDKQHFVLHIDVGEIHTRADLGIGVGFKITSPSGMAQLDNLEVIEANPLTGEALARVKKREQKWKMEREHQCMETEKAVPSAMQAVNTLFTSTEKIRLKPTTTMQEIQSAEAKVNAIPYIHNPVFEDLPGMNYAIFQALQSDIQTAFELYNQRNVIRNGDFNGGLSNWHATAGASVQERDGNPHVLVISQWDANVAQDVCVEPDRGYVVRVTARKEGSGKGYVTISDCTEENTETMTFTSEGISVIDRKPVEVAPSSICDITNSYNYVTETSVYNPNVMENHTTENLNPTSCSCGSSGKASCSCDSDYMRNNAAEWNAAQFYRSTQHSPGRSSAYITKTIEMFPETNRIRIEIGETEGMFLVESVELICMED
ncbi:insecticidal delta-endotoxin Cry8Ea1 family protein (plasmid) [Bacillus toyonensis]